MLANPAGTSWQKNQQPIQCMSHLMLQDQQEVLKEYIRLIIPWHNQNCSLRLDFIPKRCNSFLISLVSYSLGISTDVVVVLVA